MRTVELQLGAGVAHVSRLASAHDPAGAIVELVWNSIDAEANVIDVTFERGPTRTIEKVVITDDGHGIPAGNVERTFGTIGSSWKHGKRHSKNGKRSLHGRNGQGRLRAFALGRQISWTSRSGTTTSGRSLVRISADYASANHFKIAVERQESPHPNGTRFVATGGQASLNALDSKDAITKLLHHFAPLLIPEVGVRLTYGGQELRAEDHYDEDPSVYPLVGEWGVATARIYHWKSAARHTPRQVHFVGSSDGPSYSEDASAWDARFSYTVVVTCASLGPELVAQLQLGSLAEPSVAALWNAVILQVRDHFTWCHQRQARHSLERWREKKVHPYAGIPTTFTDEINRVVFDTVSGTMWQYVPKDEKQARLTLRLLQDALRRHPDDVLVLLQDVLSLSSEEMTKLRDLLRQTTMSAILTAAARIANRRRFLAGLEAILFGEDSRKVRERDHLHKILENELWIFGEGYSSMRSEKGLTDLARTHLKLGGLPVDKVEPVKLHTGKPGRVDLHLAVNDVLYDRKRHLVVELKAPHVCLGRPEINQVKDYANAILDGGVFRDPNAEWDFILVGASYSEIAGREVQPGRKDGLVWQHKEPNLPQVRLFMRSWRHVIEENRRRLDFVSRDLELDPSTADGLQYLRDTYRDLLPPELAEPILKPPMDGQEPVAG